MRLLGGRQIMGRATFALGLAAWSAAALAPAPGRSQAPAEETLAGEALPELLGSPCVDAQRCRTIERRGPTAGVEVELVMDGSDMELAALHLVIRRAGRSWILRHVGASGTACDSFEMFYMSFYLERLELRDRLHGPRPEVLLISSGEGSRGDRLCSTDPETPRCVTLPLFTPTRGVRFLGRDRVRIRDEGFRVNLDAP